MKFSPEARLPYRVQVDFIVRTFLLVLLATVLFLAYTTRRARRRALVCCGEPMARRP
ncbi:MAG TPA: hypothetical protein VF395_02635 [Polyangiaceae bacterium]